MKRSMKGRPVKIPVPSLMKALICRSIKAEAGPIIARKHDNIIVYAIFVNVHHPGFRCEKIP